MYNILFKFLLIITSTLSIQVVAASLTNFDRLLEKSATDKGPGKAVVISQKGRIIYSNAKGMANIELGVPLSSHNVFRIGSLTKQFTSAAIMMLQEQGKLSIKDNISKYVPDFPTEGYQISIEHLMSHTSGIANYTDNDITWDTLIQEPTTIDKMLTLFAKEPMYFPPGEAMRYSNTGYVLLGKIIEQVSKQSYADFVEQHIFKVLGMENSQYGGRQIINNRASGYARTETGYENATSIDMSWPYSSGSLVSTVKDLAIWNNALTSGKLISKHSYHKMTSPFKLNNGKQSTYGFGLRNTQIGKYKTISHIGAIQGFTVYSVYIPQLEVYIAVAANYEGSRPETLGVLLAAEILGITTPNFEPANINQEQLKPLMGKYQITPNSSRTLSIENGVIYAQRDKGGKSEIIPMSDNSFYYKDSLTYFVIEKGKDGTLVMNFYLRLSETPTKAKKV